MDYGEKLIEELDNASSWPLQRETAPIGAVQIRRAFRRGDKQQLRQIAGWDIASSEGSPEQRPYVVDPLPKAISKAYADFLFGGGVTITAAKEEDQKRLDEIVNENRLTSELHRAERICSSEGEVWWRIYVDKTIAPCPLIQWTTRLDVVPLFRGGRLLAAAFLTVICEKRSKEDDEPTIVYRYAEVHSDGAVRNRLYEGEYTELGKPVSLKALPETENLPEEWRHDLPMLTGRIINDRDEVEDLGASDYDQVQDLLLALNEARTIAVENAKLTAKKRLFVSGSLARSDGTFDAGADVIEVTQEDQELGEDNKPPIVAVEYSFDAEPLIAHKRELEDTILTRVGLVPQMFGRDVDGQAESGTAIRLKFLPTTNTAEGKAGPWDEDVPEILRLTACVDALSDKESGYGKPYEDTTSQPTFERKEILPVDEGETIVDNATAVTAGIRSRRTAILRQHSDWTEQMADAELEAIKEDTQLEAPSDFTP